MSTTEIINLTIQIAIPIIILILGIKINRTIEKNNLALLKEKEWQVRWAETYLEKAIEFNKQISTIITLLYKLSNNKSNEEKAINEKIDECIYNIQFLNWDIRNFAQFSDKGKGVIDKQIELSSKLSDIFKDKGGNMEIIRELQIEYNRLVRVVHHDILNS